MKVYITKYALTTGIFIKEVRLSNSGTNMVTEINATGYLHSYHKPDWHENKEDAIAHAEQLRKRKIASIEKNLKRISEIDFEKMINDLDK